MIHKNDLVIVSAGKDKGKEGKVLQVFPRLQRLVVENVNIATKNLRGRSRKEKGQKITYPAPLDLSNVWLKCKLCQRGVRAGSKILTDGSKVRVCKKCGEQI